MCTSIISNRNKTIVGWNLDLLGMEYRIHNHEKGVFNNRVGCLYLEPILEKILLECLPAGLLMEEAIRKKRKRIFYCWIWIC